MAEQFSMTVFLSFYNLFYDLFWIFLYRYIYILVLNYVYSKTAHIWANTGVVERGVESIS